MREDEKKKPRRNWRSFVWMLGTIVIASYAAYLQRIGENEKADSDLLVIIFILVSGMFAQIVLNNHDAKQKKKGAS